MRVLAFVNQKGGCGKTTTAVNLAAALAQRDRRVLLVDLDPQAHATLGLGVDVADEPSMIDVLGDEVPLERAVVDAPGGFRVAPATEELAEFEEVAERMVYPERVLEAALAETLTRYDYVLLDCPPRADGVLTANALRAADTGLLVVECGAFALQGALKARRILERVAAEANTALSIRVVATLFDRRTRFSRDLLIGMQARFEAEMHETAIRTSVRLREAAAHGVPVQLLEPGGKAADDFDSLAEELIEEEEAAERAVELPTHPRPTPPLGRAPEGAPAAALSPSPEPPSPESRPWMP